MVEISALRRVLVIRTRTHTHKHTLTPTKRFPFTCWLHRSTTASPSPTSVGLSTQLLQRSCVTAQKPCPFVCDLVLASVATDEAVGAICPSARSL